MAVIDRVEKGTDWYDLICQELDDLREDAKASADDDEQFEVPPDGKFEFVKKQLGQIREASGFAKIPAPFVWLGPEGQIGITWKFEKSSIDLIYGVKKFIARKTTNSVQELIEPGDIPSILAKLAA